MAPIGLITTRSRADRPVDGVAVTLNGGRVRGRRRSAGADAGRRRREGSVGSLNANLKEQSFFSQGPHFLASGSAKS